MFNSYVTNYKREYNGLFSLSINTINGLMMIYLCILLSINPIIIPLCIFMYHNTIVFTHWEKQTIPLTHQSRWICHGRPGSIESLLLASEEGIPHGRGILDDEEIASPSGNQCYYNKSMGGNRQEKHRLLVNN